ncbi:MAG: coproporphyrinogen III oxidase, partial [Rhizobium sp.]
MSDALVAKYGEARLPRYTSYPTAPAFSPAVGPEQYAVGLSEIAASGPVSVYLHVPFCRSMCWYCGCHTTITERDQPIIDYLDVLQREIALVGGARQDGLDVGEI